MMETAPGSAPRSPRDENAIERDIRPAVALPPRGVPVGVIAIVALVAAMILFGVLESRRRAASAPTTRMAAVELPGSDAPPPLLLPPAPDPVTYVSPQPVSSPTPTRTVSVSPIIPRQPSTPTAAPIVIPQPIGSALPPPRPRTASGSALVIDNGAIQNDPARPVISSTNGQSSGGASAAPRAYASVIANRAATVPQGTLIQAVLETAFDSTKPGFARALVQRDIRGFDGTRVLIPRGSRLIGEYGADTSAGQNRAVIAWTRLIRPDGVSIGLASPAADPVGRGGIKADVNTHFLARFSGAILQSILDVGVNLASRSANSPVIVALPGSVGTTANQIAQPRQIPPTLSIKPGRSIAVFVARDLDFSGVGQDQ